MQSVASRKKVRRRIRYRVRSKVQGAAQRPRLSVFRSAKNIYAQVIDDATGTTVAHVSTQDKDIRGKVKHGGNIEAAKQVGQAIAAKLKDAGIESVVFDRGGFLYHGRVKALAEAAREAGLKF